MKKRKFKLQRVLPFIVAGTIATSFVGCSNKEETKEYDYPKTTLSKADDAVIYDYASEIGNDFYEKCSNSEYKDYVMNAYRERCNQPLIQMMRAYNEYLVLSGIKEAQFEDDRFMLEMFPPSEESIQREHNRFINYAQDIENYASSYNNYKFINSIYAYAIVRDEDILEYPDATQRPYYIPVEIAIDMGLLSDEYGMNNLPEEAEIIDGKLYVKCSTVTKTTKDGLILSKSK